MNTKLIQLYPVDLHFVFKRLYRQFFLFPFKMEVSEVLKIIAVKLAAKETKGELVRPPKAASLFFKV